jgi:hypothetical protein
VSATPRIFDEVAAQRAKRRERAYPESPLASRAVTAEEELREALDAGDPLAVQRALEATRESEDVEGYERP